MLRIRIKIRIRIMIRTFGGRLRRYIKILTVTPTLLPAKSKASLQ